MIHFPQLAHLINCRGREGASLRELVNSPTSKAVVGILTARTGIRIVKSSEEELFDLYVCEDGRDERHPDAFGIIFDTLRQEDVHERPLILLHADGLAELESHLSFSTLRCALFNSSDLLDLLMARPPRHFLTKRVLDEIPLSDLNPYVYRGPVSGGLFIGRERELDKLTRLRSSYALVGPRAIGKTSLINRAFEKLRAQGALVIRTEFSLALSEEQLVEQIVTFLINHYKAPPALQHRMSVAKTQRFLDWASRGFADHRAVLFVDEADEMESRCPKLTTALRTMHNNSTLRLVMVGFKALRKAAYDGKTSELMNVLEPTHLSRFKSEDCAKLVLRPMSDLGIKFEGSEQVVEIVYRESGGAPSRVQLICSALVESLTRVTQKTVDPESVKSIVQSSQVQTVFRSWFRESTSFLEKRLAGFITLLRGPMTEERLVVEVSQMIPEWTALAIKTEILDLRMADVLEELPDGTLDFTFPALRKIAQPSTDVRRALSELKSETKIQLRHDRMSRL